MPFVDTHLEDHIAWITLKRPDTLNLLTRDMLAALHTAFSDLGSQARVVVLQAEGKGFCAGHDLKDLREQPLAEVTELFETCTALMTLIHHTPCPVIASVQGLAVAAGCQLVATCDLVVASTAARFGTTGVKLGLFCATPMVPLSRVVPPRKALEMLLTGDLLSAEEAQAADLVNLVCPPESLEATTRALAAKIAAHSGYVTKAGKAAFYRQQTLALPEAYAVGKQTIIENTLHPEGQEGISAFLAKRAPQWNT